MRVSVLPEFFIPSPTVRSFELGPLTISFYALCIVAGIVLGTWLAARRLLHRGGTTAQALDIIMWAVPFGIIGGRLYHVITDNQLYFGPGKDPWAALRIWEGGLGIWGAVAGQAVTAADGTPEILGYFQPTFLYESLWCVSAAALLMFLDRRHKLGAGSVFALYIVFYTAGRFAFELMRSDYANTIMGLRVNTWVSGLLYLAGLGLFLVLRSLPRSEATAGSTSSIDAVGLRMDGHPSVPRRGTPDGKSEQYRKR